MRTEMKRVIIEGLKNNEKFVNRLSMYLSDDALEALVCGMPQTARIKDMKKYLAKYSTNNHVIINAEVDYVNIAQVWVKEEYTRIVYVSSEENKKKIEAGEYALLSGEKSDEYPIKATQTFHSNRSFDLDDPEIEVIYY